MRRSDIEALVSCEIFNGLKENDIQKLCDTTAFEIKEFKRNDPVFTPTDFRKSLAVILKGSTQVYKNRDNSSPMLMSIQTKGAIFGIPSLFSDEKDFPTTVCAKENCRILFIDREQMEDIFCMYPVTVVNYLKILSKKIYFLNDKLDRLASPDAKSRLKAYLCNIAAINGTKEFILPVSCSELSSYLSVGRTSLYRSFDELTEEGFLTRNGKNIKII